MNNITIQYSGKDTGEVRLRGEQLLVLIYEALTKGQKIGKVLKSYIPEGCKIDEIHFFTLQPGGLDCTVKKQVIKGWFVED